MQLPQTRQVSQNPAQMVRVRVVAIRVFDAQTSLKGPKTMTLRMRNALSASVRKAAPTMVHDPFFEFDVHFIVSRPSEVTPTAELEKRNNHHGRLLLFARSHDFRNMVPDRSAKTIVALYPKSTVKSPEPRQCASGANFHTLLQASRGPSITVDPMPFKSHQFAQPSISRQSATKGDSRSQIQCTRHQLSY